MEARARTPGIFKLIHVLSVLAVYVGLIATIANLLHALTHGRPPGSIDNAVEFFTLTVLALAVAWVNRFAVFCTRG